jgi:hypothetical protein
MENRRFQRMEINQLSVDVSDGYGFFSGEIKDVSRFGLKLDSIPLKLDDRAKHLSIVVSGHGKNFKMKARPCWSRTQSLSKDLGVEILNAPWGWTEFVMDFEPDRKDNWGEIIL